MAEIVTEYPFELKERPPVTANEFNWKGYLQAQGRSVMDMLQRAKAEHPAVQAGDGKPLLKKMKHKDTGRVIEINAPWRVMADGKESWAGLDDLRKLEREGYVQVEKVDYTVDPKDARIRELEEQLKGNAKRDAELAELREMVKALQKK